MSKAVRSDEMEQKSEIDMDEMNQSLVKQRGHSLSKSAIDELNKVRGK